MAVHFGCRCAERYKPVGQRAWVVTQYRWNSGDFTSGAGEPSDYSTVKCLECGSVGRTKSNYVDGLEHMKPHEAWNEWQRRVKAKNEGRKNG